MFDSPLAKFALGLACLAIVVVLGTRVLPGLNKAARLDADQSSGLTPGNEAVSGQLPAGQTFIPRVAGLVGIDLAFDAIPERISLQVKEWPEGRTVLSQVFEGSGVGCRTPHQSNKGGTCRLRWGDDGVTLTPGRQYVVLVTEWAPDGMPTFWKSRNDYPEGCFVTLGSERCDDGDVFFRTYSRDAP
jgi:hypothetical protein